MRQLPSPDFRDIGTARVRLHVPCFYSTDHEITEIADRDIGRPGLRWRTGGGISRAMEMGPRGGTAWRRSGLRANTWERTQCA